MVEEIKKIVVLIDQDGVLADWSGEALKRMNAAFPHAAVHPNEITAFHMEEFYPGLEKEFFEVIHTPGFYRSLAPIPGSLEAITQLSKDPKLDVWICTKPDAHAPTCSSEKMMWISEHLGPSWVKKTILTPDKTLVLGDVLLDDNPEITGVLEDPVWTHLCFARTWNTKTKAPRGGFELIKEYINGSNNV